MKKLFSCRLSEGALKEVGRVRASMGLKSDGAVIEEWARRSAGGRVGQTHLVAPSVPIVPVKSFDHIEVPTTIFAPMKVEPSLADERAGREPLSKPSGAIV